MERRHESCNISLIVIMVASLILLFAPMNPAHAWGSWLVNPETGCKIWAFNPAKDTAFTWTGSCKNGYVDGAGTVEWIKDGNAVNQYTGQFLLGRAHGKGGFKEFHPPTSYEGDYVNGRRSGKGVQIYANGDRYEGEWRYDSPNGKGKKTWIKGSNYVGDFVNGEMDGVGKLTLRSGRIFGGHWESSSYLGL